VRVAALQHDIVWEDRDANFARLAPRIADAAGDGARLVVLTEMFSTGFSMDTARVAEPFDGPSARFLVEQAREHDVWVCGSAPEVQAGDDLPSNTLILAAPGGSAHRYRKIHPFTYGGEHEQYAAGDAHLTVDVDGLRCSFFVCYDLRFADEFWQRAGQTDVYLVPANWPASRRLHWQTLLQARAIENQAYVVGCNRVGTAGDGTEHVGDTRIVSPMGELLATAAGGETIVLADVEAAEVAATRDRLRFLADRRS
jgi:predicted amidohydrolase